MLLKPACRIESFEIGSIGLCPPHIELRDLKVLFLNTNLNMFHFMNSRTLKYARPL